MNDNNKLEHYLAAWNLAEPQFLTRTVTSSIYTVRQGGETVILKVLSASETTEQVGALALRYFDGHGVVRLLRYDAGAHLLEQAAGDELIRLVEQGQDEAATRLFAEVIGQLHSVSQEGGQEGLFALESWFGDLFSQAAADKLARSESI
jgi:streptomycin 6-kinase